MMTNITIVGNTTAPADLKFTQNGIAVCTFTVAVNERKKGPDGWADDGATFYRVNVWRDYAENVAEALEDKSSPVIVTGKIRTREYERRDGEKGYSLEVTADEVALTVPRSRKTRRPESDYSAGSHVRSQR